MEPDPNLQPTSINNYNEQWNSEKAILNNSGEEVLCLSSRNYTNSNDEAVVCGQDMVLPQRPLLESPLRSESSEGGDSIEGNMQEDCIDHINERTSDKFDNIEPRHIESGVKKKFEANPTTTVFRSISGNSISNEVTSGQIDSVDHFKVKCDTQSTKDVVAPSSWSDHIPIPIVGLGHKKRERSTNDSRLANNNVANPPKKVRHGAGFGMDMNASGVSTLAFASCSATKETAGQTLVQHGLGDGHGFEKKLLETYTQDRLLKKTVQDRLMSSPTPTVKADISNLSPGMFDDAEDDETFDPNLFKKRIKQSSPRPSVRPDLVAAILGSPSKHSLGPAPIFDDPPSMAIVPFDALEQEDKPEETKKANISRPVKKVWIAKKEQDAAISKFRGKIDLQRVLSEEHCHFLGSRCFLFTLQQLEYVLDDDENAPDALLREKLRRRMIEKLAEDKLVDRNESCKNGIVDGKPKACSTKARIGSVDQTSESMSETAKVVLSNGSSDSTPPISPKSKWAQTQLSLEGIKIEKAVQMFDRWRKSINEWRKKGSVSLKDETQFSLLGPLSLFIPKGTRQFFQSINLQDAVELLSLKKTETGLVVDLFKAWRSKCGLKRKQPLALAKHLLGISSRIEMAVGNKTGIDPDDIEWINDAMVIVTGAAKDFIVDECKIFSAERFIEMRTKLLADKLSDWRSKMGLPVLKGSGKVAMVSAWKSLLKDEVDLQKSVGRVIPNEDLRFSAEAEGTAESPTKKRRSDPEEDGQKRIETKLILPRYVTPAAIAASKSESFFVDIFGEEERIMTMFRTLGITTGEQLLEADKGQNSDFLKAVIRMKMEQTGGNIQPSSCIRLLYNWAAKVKARLDDLEQGKASEGSKIEKKVDSSIQAKKEFARSFQRERKSSSNDPFNALSVSSKEFLATMGIKTAAQFLSARTTDVANAFVAWRAEKKFAALKGLGAVASVSGWKKLVRNRAATLGDDDLALLNQASNSKAPVQDKSGEKTKKFESQGFFECQATVDIEKVDKRNHIAALSKSGDTSFHFEVDVRLGPDNEERQYLTYIGSSRISDARTKSSLASQPNSVMENLNEASASVSGRQPYQSSKAGMLNLRCFNLFCDAKDAGKLSSSDANCGGAASLTMFISRDKSALYC
jgi:hypothetical protein